MLCDCFKRELGHSRYLLLLFLLAVGRAHADDTADVALDNSVDHVFADIISELDVVLPAPVAATVPSAGRRTDDATKPKLLETVIVAPNESGGKEHPIDGATETPASTLSTGGDASRPDMRLAELKPYTSQSPLPNSGEPTKTFTEPQVDPNSDDVVPGTATDSQEDSAIEAEVDLEIPSPPVVSGEGSDSIDAMESPVPPVMKDDQDADALGIELSDSPSIDLTTEEVPPTSESPEPTDVETSTDQVEAAEPVDVSSDATASPESLEVDADVSPTTPARPMVVPRNVALMRRPIENVLRIHVEKRLNANDDSCWSMMHSFLGWGPNTKIEVGGWRKRYVNAIEYVATNQSCAGRHLFYLDKGRIKGREGPGYQGHPAQFVAMLAQCNVRPNYPIRVSNQSFTVEDLIREEQRTCRDGVELTFKAIAFAHYLDTETRWTNDWGETWSLDRVLGVELSQPINGAACGGTHRLMAISYALAKRREEGRPLDGNFANAARYISDYHNYTRTLANRDGTFSSDWFKRRTRWGGIDRGIQTTGHIAEWLVFSVSDEQLFEPHIVNAVGFLTRTLQQHRHHEWEVGPKGHAIRALRLYHQRVFQQATIPVSPLAQRGRVPQR